MALKKPILEPGGPGERRRTALRRRIYYEAARQFEENGGESGGGYDTTTVEQIAERSDISVRTFFRYFRSKADVIYVDLPSTIEYHLAWVKQRLEVSPPAAACLEASALQLTYTMTDELDAARVERSLSSATFMARRGLFRAQWKDRLAALIEPFMDGEDDAIRASVVAALALETHDLALSRWHTSGGAIDVLECLKDALDAVRTAATVALPERLVALHDLGPKSIEQAPAQRRRSMQRRRIVLEAGRLFDENGGEEGGGLEKTTVADIAERSDISVRTFFRFFQSKMDVIYLDPTLAMKEQLDLARLWSTRMPVADACLMAAALQLKDSMEDEVNAARHRRAMASQTYIERRGSFRAEWKAELAALILEHLPRGRDAALRAESLAGTILEVREMALDRWSRSDGAEDLVTGFDAALDRIRRVASEDVPKRIDPAVDYRKLEGTTPRRKSAA